MSMLIPRRKLLGAAGLLGMFGAGRASAAFVPPAEAMTPAQKAVLMSGGQQVAQPISSLATRRRIAAIGDSIASDAIGSNTATSIIWSNWGFLAWMRRFLNQRMYFPIGNIFAVSGTKVSDAVAQAQQVVALGNVDICVVHTGTNSLGVETVPAMQSEYTQIITTLKNAGIFVIVDAILAHSGGQALSGTPLLQQCFINKWLANLCRLTPGTYYFDANPILIDFATGNAQAGYLQDGINPTQVGTILIGQALASVINGLVPSNQDHFTLLGDLYDAVNNPAGNLLGHGLLDGSGGETGNGATGTVPTGWGASRVANSGTVTLVLSAAADSSYVNLNKCRLTFGGVADGNGGQIIQQKTLSPPTAGQYVWGACDVVPNLTTANMGTIYLKVAFLNSGYGYIAASQDGYDNSYGDLPAGFATPFSLRTEPLLVPASATYLQYEFHATPDTSGSLTAAVDVERCECRIESYLI